MLDDIACSCLYVTNPGRSFVYIPWSGAVYYRDFTRIINGATYGRIIVDIEGDDNSPYIIDIAGATSNYYEMRDAVAAKIRAYIAANKPNT